MIDTSILFTPVTIGSVTVPNRFVLPGMQRGWCKDGAPEDRLDDYYRRRVEGGVGLIISESLAVDHPSSTQTDMFARLDGDTVEAWRRTVGTVRDAGGAMILQLWHEGALRKEGGDSRWSQHPTLSPSGLAFADKRVGQVASGDDLAAIRDGFIRSAILAKQAGANGVEVHGAHGYLLDQFLWPVTNRRDDGYGGDDMRDRVRLPAEIIAGIRAECGPDFLISFRFSQWKEADFEARVAPGPDDLALMVTALRDAGADVLHASTRRFWQPEWAGSDLNLAGWAKQLSGLPAITVGSIGLNTDVMSTFFGEEVEGRVERGVAELVRRLSAGEFDLAAIGRSLIADPDWVLKIRDGNFDAVRIFTRDDLSLPDADMGLVGEAHGRN
ncbi:12-oxophytodienoate reductase [Altererythrobacter xixiisoli]|uniref:12-oxophytodienoate reductase n=1 Tax=Croceibacterium xixiisoli TaxID=1476466 RepID=A0A6I4TR73_9SPHN|nr:12-oxophytodienoate reductase [Croceibacterium xixiisoli]MXO97809.1 12-oxophytodienoate reductase [Croceibacterium xixiisoli]